MFDDTYSIFGFHGSVDDRLNLITWLTDWIFLPAFGIQTMVSDNMDFEAFFFFLNKFLEQNKAFFHHSF